MTNADDVIETTDEKNVKISYFSQNEKEDAEKYAFTKGMLFGKLVGAVVIFVLIIVTGHFMW